MSGTMSYHDAMEALIEARASQIEKHLPAEVPDHCPGCGKLIRYAKYVDVRRNWARHLAEETYRG